MGECLNCHQASTRCPSWLRFRPDPPPKPKAKRKEIKFLTEDELDRLFSAIHSVRDRAIFQIAYRAGLRASEVGLLPMRDYDPKADKMSASGFDIIVSPM